jgi:hypothetical protein
VAGCNDYGNTFQYNGGAALTFISPSQLPAGSPQFTLTMSGSGFVAQTLVQWNGKTCPTTGSNGQPPSGAPCGTTVAVDSNGNVLTVTATILASLVAKPGLVTVNTIQPSTGGTGFNGLSNPINFIIDNPPNPAPTVSSVSPTCATVGSGLSLTVTGTNFLTGPANTTPPQISTVLWTLGGLQGQFTAGSSSTSTQITVQVPAANVSAPGTASITVSNPPSLPISNIPGSQGSGGGTSSPAQTVTVQTASCPVAAKAGDVAADSTTAIAEETPAVSLDGRYVAYTAMQDGHAQIYLHDTCEGAASPCQTSTTLLSVSSAGSSAIGDSHSPSMSSDGRYVAFSSAASNLADNAPPGRQIYLRDTCAGAGESCKPSTQLISTDSNGALVGTESILPSVSSSGRFIAFLAITLSHSAKLASDESSSSPATNSGYRQVFVRDTCLGATNCTPRTTRISLQPGDAADSATRHAGHRQRKRLNAVYPLRRGG